MEHASFWREFFQIYKDLPALWRVKSTIYTDRVLKAKCYTKLIKKLKEIHPDADREMVVRKINNFRTSYRKELKRMKECRLMGKDYKPTLWYFDYLRFLDDQDDGWLEKSTNEIENMEEKKQESPPTLMTGKAMTATKHSSGDDFGKNEKECLPNVAQRRKLTHHFHKKSTRKPSFAEKQEAKNDAEILAKSWAVQYKGMQENQKIIARKLISDILFYGSLGVLNASSATDLQETFLQDPISPMEHLMLQQDSPRESNSSFHIAEPEYFNYGSSHEESPIEFNSSSQPMSPRTNSAADIQVNDIKYEVP